MSSTSMRREIWRERIVDWWAGTWRWVLTAVGAVAAVYLVLDRGLQNGSMTAVAIAGLVIGAAVTRSQPLAIVLMSLPGLLIVQRVGLGGTDLSFSDVALAAAFGTALLLGRRPYSRPLRQLLWLNLFYQFATLFTVIVNPYLANTVEWFHAWLLISGALIVGWAVGARGYARLGLSLIVGAAVIIALITVVQGAIEYASGDFGPVYPVWPFPMHKNFVGTVMAIAAAVVYINPDWAGWTRGWAWTAFWLLFGALLLSQSRQALIGLMAAILIAVIRRRVTGRSRFVYLLMIPAVWLIASMVIEQIESQNRHNSVFQRLNWFREVYHYWRESPIFGHGLRYWYNDSPVPFQPPQAEIEVLASAGVVGLVGFLVMWLGIIVVLWRVDPRFGTLAVAVASARLVQAQFDLFWTAATVSIPFVIAGICLGAMAQEQRNAPSEPVDTRVVRGPQLRKIPSR
ncbi:O-antigen ligase family protein [Agromyces sp. NPDC049794]|uniref:O-antigen ligase family protein n=1 Tax=unclassified Agromyces TaxID=2639701 RepID=UPI0033C6653C